MSSVITVTADELALPLEQHVARTSAALDSFGHLIALASPDPGDPARRRLHTVRAALEADRLAIVPVDLPPLATALLCEQLRQLAGTDLGPGVLAGAARLLSYYLYSGALLGSVTKLDRVPVTVGRHFKSLVPGRHFVVMAHPHPGVSEAGPDAVPGGPAFLTQLAVAGHGVDPGWITGPLASAWRTQHIREVPLPPESARWWGTGRLVEFTAYIADIGVLYQLVTSVRRDTCPWCGLEVIGDQCLFCSTRLGDRTRPVAAAQQQLGQQQQQQQQRPHEIGQRQQQSPQHRRPQDQDQRARELATPDRPQLEPHKR
ncbi:hypothetical protein QMK19_23460 [Streptomyces sp. H10-C2]|uniref:hypothetical protein n=1 Tax=Streptomyces sp. H10-C2 TaxID=3046210 RepID=UPI0024BA9ABA|nr:hypothetical protein [Streptomyces sp. H10-C2]MDJ0372542.1 hypothetical protein [Streptomyces sp. H10-C2]